MKTDFFYKSSGGSSKCFLKLSIDDINLIILCERYVDNEELFYNLKGYILDILYLERI